jgi:hypothetical protein
MFTIKMPEFPEIDFAFCYDDMLAISCGVLAATFILNFEMNFS